MPDKKIGSAADLDRAIAELEKKIIYRETSITVASGEMKDAMQPKRLLSNTFASLAETPEIKKILINTAIGFLIGYASRKSVQLLSEASINRFAENFVNHHLTKIEQKKPDSFLSKAITFIRKYTPPASPLYGFVKY